MSKVNDPRLEIGDDDSSFGADKFSPGLEVFIGKAQNSYEISVLSPIFCIGLTRCEVHLMRNSYISYTDDYDVRIIGFYSNHNIIPRRLGVLPRVIVLKDVEITGELRTYIRRNRIPVLRILQNRVALVNLPFSDYYSGVYETLGYDDIRNSRLVTSMIELGIRIYNRNRGDNTDMSEFARQSMREVLEIPNTVANADMLIKHLFS